MAENIYSWSTTAASNDTADSGINWQENQLPGTVNGSARAMMAAHAKWFGDANGTLSTAGSSNAYTVASPNIAYSAYVDGIVLSVTASFTNTAAATLDLRSLGAKAIVTNENGAAADVYPGEITSGGHYLLQYDSALASGSGAWVLINPSPRAGKLEPFLGATAPGGWALSYGQEVAQATYPATYTVFGTAYNTGGETAGYFRVPDLRGRSLFGKDNMGGSAASRVTTAASNVDGATLGATGGAQTHTLSTSETPSHTHTGTSDSGGSHSHTGTTDSESAHTHAGTTDATTASHTHTYSGTTDSGGVDHAHLYSQALYAGLAAAGGIGPYSTTAGAAATGGATGYLHTHTYSGTTASGGASHTHTFTTGAGSAHTHTFTTSTASAHTHTFTTAATGGGGAHNNMPPALICNFIVRLA